VQQLHLWEVKLIGRAIRERWPIPADLRQLSIMQLEQALLQADDWRIRIAAIRVLLAADRLNLDQEKLDRLAEIEATLAEMEARVAGGHHSTAPTPGPPVAAGEPPPQPDGGVPQ